MAIEGGGKRSAVTHVDDEVADVVERPVETVVVQQVLDGWLEHRVVNFFSASWLEICENRLKAMGLVC